MALNRDGTVTDTVECMRACARAGYRVLDINWRFVRFRGWFLTRDDWERVVDRIGGEAARLGIEFSQCHLPYYSAVNQVDEYLSDPALHEWFEGMVRRALQASRMLGIKWAVAHAFTDLESRCETAASRRMNLEYFGPHVELASRLGIGIAIENLADFHGSTIPRRYTATHEELVDLVDAFADPAVGICWDFGHGNLMRLDQRRALRHVGRRLKATHVNDNFGVIDAHNLPYMGRVDWDEVMAGLSEIGYEGDFTYEVHGLTDALPLELKPQAIRYSWEVGSHLMSLAR